MGEDSPLHIGQGHIEQVMKVIKNDIDTFAGLISSAVSEETV
jgi:hypothetical protein